MRAGALSRGKESITLVDLGAMLRNSMAGIQARGGASLGDKTVLDALEPIAATNNYQGDRMCWDMAKEMAEAEGITIGTVIVDDDVSVQNSTYTVGRRGVAGNFFVIKACGAAAEAGRTLHQLVELGQKVNSVVRTMGVALTGCTPPAKGKPIFELSDDEMEVGVGIHGEPGRRRAQLQSADAIVEEVFEAVAGALPFKSGDKVGLMINGLGGTPISFTYSIVARRSFRKSVAWRLCATMSVIIARRSKWLGCR